MKLTSKEANESEDATKYKKLLGSFIYPTTTISDILFVVRILSKFMQKNCEGNYSIEKGVLKYLKGTQYFGLKYSQVNDFSLTGYSDSVFDKNNENKVLS